MATPDNPQESAPKKQELFATVFFSLIAVLVLYLVVSALVNKITTPTSHRAVTTTIESPPYITSYNFGPLAPEAVQVVTKLGGVHLQGMFHPAQLTLVSAQPIASGEIDIVRQGQPPRSGPVLKVSPQAVFTAMGDMEAYAEHHAVERFSVHGKTAGTVSFRVQPASESIRYLAIDSDPENIREFWPDNTDRSPQYPNAVAAFMNERSARTPSILDTQDDRRVNEGLFRFYQGICETAVRARPIQDRLHISVVPLGGLAKVEAELAAKPPRLPQIAAEHLVCESQGAAMAFARTGIPYATYAQTIKSDYSQSFEGELVANYHAVNLDEYEHDTITD